MLTTHIFQHTLFDWLKFTWVPTNLYGSHMIWWGALMVHKEILMHPA